MLVIAMKQQKEESCAGQKSPFSKGWCQMSEFSIALLELLSVGGVGLAVAIAGVLIKVIGAKKNAACTMMTKGVVVGHGFAGSGRFYPVVEFEANGERFTTRKKFNGIISVRQTGLPLPLSNDAWEDNKGYLHVQTGAIADMGLLAEKLWPLNSQMSVFYDPRNPKKNYVERPVSNSVTSRIFVLAGIGVILLAVVVFFLMQG